MPLSSPRNKFSTDKLLVCCGVQGRLGHIWCQKWDPNAHALIESALGRFSFVFLSVPCRVKSRTKSRGLESDVNAINRGRDKFKFVDIEGDSVARRTGPQVSGSLAC